MSPRSQRATPKPKPTPARKPSLTYAGSKRKAELALEEFSDRLNWISVRPITVFNPKTPDWGRPMNLPDLANLAFTPMIGSGQQKLQPLYIGDLAKAGRLIESPLKGGQVFEAVGPEQITQQRRSCCCAARPMPSPPSA